jgi:hypothetical protein
LPDHRQCQPQRNKRNIDHNAVKIQLRQLHRRQIPDIQPLEIDHPWVNLQLLMQLTGPDIHANYSRGPVQLIEANRLHEPHNCQHPPVCFKDVFQSPEFLFQKSETLLAERIPQRICNMPLNLIHPA